MSRRRTLVAALAGWLTASGLGVALWRRRSTPRGEALGVSPSTEEDRSAGQSRSAAAPQGTGARPSSVSGDRSPGDRSRGRGGTGTESAPALHERTEPTDQTAEAEHRGRLTEGPVDAEALRLGHQPESDTPLRWVVLFLVALTLLIAAVMGAASLLFGRTVDHHEAQARAAETPFGDVRTVPPEPRLQADPALDLAADLAAVRAAEDHVLTTYGRAPGGGLRIPIDRAMALVVADGFPVDTALGLTSTDRRVPTESGWTRARLGPRPAASPAYPGVAPAEAGLPPMDSPVPPATPPQP